RVRHRWPVVALSALLVALGPMLIRDDPLRRAVAQEKVVLKEEQAPRQTVAPGAPDDEPTGFSAMPNRAPAELGEVGCIAFSPGGRRLASGMKGEGSWGVLRLIEVASRKERARIRQARPIRALAFAPDGKALAVAEADDMVSFRDPATGEVRST